jgi:uncharacterized protein
MKQFLRYILGIAFLILGIVGLFLPILQGILFIMIGLLILAPNNRLIKKLLVWVRRKYPKIFSRASHFLRITKKHKNETMNTHQ